VTTEEKRRRRAERERERYQRKKSIGRCPICGGERDAEGLVCSRCLEVRRDHEKTPEKREWRSEWDKTSKQRKFRREQQRRLRRSRHSVRAF